MHGWKQVDTARCERCSVYTPTTDLVFSTDGRPFCTGCGVPKTAPPPRPRVYAAPSHVGSDAGLADWAPSPQLHLEHHARVAALVMLVVTLCFPLAACVSQL